MLFKILILSVVIVIATLVFIKLSTVYFDFMWWLESKIHRYYVNFINLFAMWLITFGILYLTLAVALNSN